MVKAYAGKPVKFIAVASMNPAQAQRYQRETGLAMPIFADNQGLMQARHGFKISLQNIWQFRIFDGEGKIAATQFDEDSIEKAVRRVIEPTRFLQLEVDASLTPVLQSFEFGQYALGAKQLAPLRKSTSKAVHNSVSQVQAALKKEAETWKKAAAEAGSNTVVAYDLYTRLATVLPNDELGKEAQKALKPLAADKAVKSELAARAVYQKLSQSLSTAPAASKTALSKAFRNLAKNHADTPTAAKALALAEELDGER